MNEQEINNKPNIIQTAQATITVAEFEALKNKNANIALDDAVKSKIIDAQMRSDANERAVREPIPAVVDDVFDNTPLTVKTSRGEVVIRPMVAYDINIFKLINSPFYRIMVETITDENRKARLFAEDEEWYELVYQFTHPAHEVYKLFKRGPEVYKDTVMESIACAYSPADVVLLRDSVMLHIFKVNMTRVAFEASAPTAEPPQDTTKYATPELAAQVAEVKKN